MNDENFLLLAVNKLTQNHTSRVMQTKSIGQRDEEGELLETIDIACISTVDHEPLLLQLRDAVVGGIGSHAGSSSARERIPFDAGALALFDQIAAQINAWYITLPNAREERYIHDRLRDWYIDYSNRLRAGKVGDATELATLRMVESWAHRIEAMFDPPTTLEITSPCPVCGERWAFDPKTGDKIGSLILEYRNLGVETLDKATGLCRSCATVWRGRTALRELRYDMEVAEPGNDGTAA